MRLILYILAIPLLAFGHEQTSLVSGNGHGYISLDPVTASLNRFWAHPYKYEKEDPQDPHGEGIETASFVTSGSWQKDGKNIGGPLSYKSESHVIEGQKQNFFMPQGLNRNAMITSSAVPGSCLHLNWKNKLKASQEKKIGNRRVRVLSFEGVKESLVVVPLEEEARLSGDSCISGSSGMALLVVKDPHDAEAAVKDLDRWKANTSPADLAHREALEREQRRSSATPCFKSEQERKVYRQSETILQMAQIRENKANGLINASLEGDFVIPFVRDQAYSTVALVEAGYKDEARQSLNALLNAGPIGKNKTSARGLDYQISTVRYFGDGSEEADRSDEKEPNFELDGWGLALWSSGEYFKKYNDRAWLESPTNRGSVYQNLKDYVVKPLLGNLDHYGGGEIVTKDSSVWEQNALERKHYAFSTIAAIAGLKRFLPMAEAMGDQETTKMVKEKISSLQRGFKAAFVRGNQIRGTLERSPMNETDGAVLEAINLGVIDDPQLIKSTLSRMKILSTRSGGYRRVTGDSWYDRQEFLLINFNYARVLLRQGRFDEADKIVNRMLQKASQDNHIIPELYNSTGDGEEKTSIGAPAGARPMVGYGAGAYIMYLAERQRLDPRGRTGCLPTTQYSEEGSSRTTH